MGMGSVEAEVAGTGMATVVVVAAAVVVVAAVVDTDTSGYK